MQKDAEIRVETFACPIKPFQTKKAPTEVNAPKTQTPICRQTKLYRISTNKLCKYTSSLESAFLSNSVMKYTNGKRYNTPFVKRSSSYTTGIQFCSACLLYHIFEEISSVFVKLLSSSSLPTRKTKKHCNGDLLYHRSP